MVQKKVGVFIYITLFMVVLINFVSAINLQVDKQIVEDVIIKEIDNEAVFEFTIQNLGSPDSFEFYSLVGVEISPKDMFTLATGETKKITVRIKAGESVKRNIGYYTFVYKIKSTNSGTQEDKLTIRIVNLKDALGLSADNISPDSEKITVSLENKEKYNFDSIEAKLSSAFFQVQETFALPQLERKFFTIDLDKDKLKTLTAGPYILTTNLKVGNITEKFESTINFLEKSGLLTEENREGIVIFRHEIEKRNGGNLVTLAEISIRKNVLSRLFTTFSIAPSKSERNGFFVSYYWQQELRPGETLTVVAKTNWVLPIIIVVVLAFLLFLVQVYLTSDLILKKRISFVKSKGGEFALKVSINVKARRFVEKIEVLDKLPPIVKIYERYGTVHPDRVDEKNKRLSWNIESLNAGGETVLSYIVYSKIGVVGKFELPAATAVYEKSGKIKETSSNKVFFVNEPRRKTDEY